jgi:hypothetical protein
MKRLNKYPHPNAKLAATWLAVGVMAICATASQAQSLIAQWTFDQTNAPFADAGPNDIQLNLVPNTTPPFSHPGVVGLSTELNWQNPPGTSTSLTATNAALQTDSFGFSFWIEPNYINQYDNFLVKEMAPNYSIPGYAALSWQVQMAGDDGSGTAPINLEVRGDTGTNFYGSVSTVSNIVLYGVGGPNTNWIFVAGGYDTQSGAMSIYWNGVGATASGLPGATSSDGSPFDVGTGSNGTNFVTFSAGTLIDDLQLYDAPLTAVQVAWLMAHPGQVLSTTPAPPKFAITAFSYLLTTGNMVTTFNSVSGQNYSVYASANLTSWQSVTNIAASGPSTIVTLNSAAVAQTIGAPNNSRLFLRIATP